MKKLLWIAAAIIAYNYFKKQGAVAGNSMSNQTMRAGLQAMNGNPALMFAPSDAARSQG